MSVEQIPTIGRVVHYHSYGTPGGEYKPEPRAAIVTAVYTNEHGKVSGVDICVVNPTGLFFNQDVRYMEEPTPGCWSWPPRV